MSPVRFSHSGWPQAYWLHLRQPAGQGKDIKKGDFIGILNSSIIGSAEDRMSAAKLLLDEIKIPIKSPFLISLPSIWVSLTEYVTCPLFTFRMALLAFNPDQPADVNEANMLEAIRNVKSGQVTYSHFLQPRSPPDWQPSQYWNCSEE
jgi:dihydroxyacetone kinase-like predicted kinase